MPPCRTARAREHEPRNRRTWPCWGPSEALPPPSPPPPPGPPSLTCALSLTPPHPTSVRTHSPTAPHPDHDEHEHHRAGGGHKPGGRVRRAHRLLRRLGPRDGRRRPRRLRSWGGRARSAASLPAPRTQTGTPPAPAHVGPIAAVVEARAPTLAPVPPSKVGCRRGRPDPRRWGFGAALGGGCGGEPFRDQRGVQKGRVGPDAESGDLRVFAGPLEGGGAAPALQRTVSVSAYDDP